MRTTVVPVTGLIHYKIKFVFTKNDWQMMAKSKHKNIFWFFSFAKKCDIDNIRIPRNFNSSLETNFFHMNLFWPQFKKRIVYKWRHTYVWPPFVWAYELLSHAQKNDNRNRRFSKGKKVTFLTQFSMLHLLSKEIIDLNWFKSNVIYLWFLRKGMEIFVDNFNSAVALTLDWGSFLNSGKQ